MDSRDETMDGIDASEYVTVGSDEPTVKVTAEGEWWWAEQGSVAERAETIPEAVRRVRRTNGYVTEEEVHTPASGDAKKTPYTIRAWAREAGEAGLAREEARLECAADWLENEPWPLGGHHTIVARMNTDAVSRHLAMFIERHMHGEQVTEAERAAAAAELARVGYRATWDGEREHPAVAPPAAAPAHKEEG